MPSLSLGDEKPPDSKSAPTESDRVNVIKDEARIHPGTYGGRHIPLTRCHGWDVVDMDCSDDE
jgi:hypothetical protein